MILLMVDAAIPLVPNGIARAALGVVRWAVEKYLPDEVAAPALPAASAVGAAPDEVKSFVTELFALARGYVKGAFVLRLYDIAVKLFEGRVLDAAWDAIFAPPAMAAGACPDACPCCPEVLAELEAAVEAA